MESNLLLNRYVVQEGLGSGSGGTVNLAWDTRIQRNVAIKRIPLPPNSNQVMAPGLEEARTAAQLHDSRIVNVYDFEIEGNEALLIMEFVDGMSLGTLMDRIPRKLDLDEITSVVQNVGKALQHAHQHHVLHLDVKPDNILINTSGQSKVTDFGIGKLASSKFIPNMQMPTQVTDLTAMYGAAAGGTIGYMPPEQIEGQNVTAKTDQWAFAVLIYELLVGENPFIAPTFEQSLFELRNANIVVPSATNIELSEDVDDILFRAMSLNPEDRYSSIAQFVSAIMPYLGEPKKGKTRLAKLTETLQDPITLGSPQDRMAALKKLSLVPSIENEEDACDTYDAYGSDNADDADDKTISTDGKWYNDKRSLTSSEADEYTGIQRQHLSYTPDESYDERLPAKELPQIKNCISSKVAKVITKVVGGLACAIVSFMGMCGLMCMDEQISTGVLQNGLAAIFSSTNFALPTITIIVSGAMAVVGALWPRFGSFASLIVLGVGTIASGYTANGAVILATSAIWWAFVGRLSNEASNCCLLAPCLGVISLAYMQPILCGWCLDLKKAILTSVMGVVLMVTLFPITGGGDVFACTLQFAPHNTANDLAASSVYGKTWVWINAAGWIASTAAMWLLAKHGNKLLSLMGIALATAIIVVSRGLGAITGGIVGQIFSPVAVAALALPFVAMAFVIWMCDDA